MTWIIALLCATTVSNGLAGLYLHWRLQCREKDLEQAIKDLVVLMHQLDVMGATPATLNSRVSGLAWDLMHRAREGASYE